MKTLLVIGASNSSQSINRTLAAHAANLVQGAESILVDLRNYSLPLYAPDLEKTTGVPEAAKKFVTLIEECDGLVLSLAEYNGSYTPAFKNLFDWGTRHKGKIWSDKPMLLLSTSPGGRGGISVMEAALARFPHLGGNIIAHFSLPSFQDNFEEGKGISQPELDAKLQEAVAAFSAAL